MGVPLDLDIGWGTVKPPAHWPLRPEGSHWSVRGLVGHWGMREGQGLDVWDASGKGNHGLMVGGPTWVAGDRGGALEFALASAQYVDLGTGIDPRSFLSIIAWVKTSTTGALAFICDHDVGGADRLWQFRKATNEKIDFVVWNQAGAFGQAVGSVNISDGEWHHVAGTWDGVRIRVYVDGLMDGTGTAYAGASLKADVGTKCYIARHGVTPGYWDGLIGPVSIYERAVSADEIGLLNTYPSIPYLPPTDPWVLAAIAARQDRFNPGIRGRLNPDMVM